MDFSIIVPLESHRGMAEQCLDGWVTQAFPRERFEILLAAPEKHDQAHLHALANRLAAHDRIIPLPLDHDLALVAEAARQAQGEILVFTEAHCVPERNFLEQSAAIFADHPDWSGFSGRSIPVTHNLLSEIEAEMYNRDITRNMERHQWLKVLDQCFVIRQDAYRACGGVEPQFGHFAEWLLAARLHRQGSRIGFDPRAAIHHYYVGDLEALEEFTLDFAAGQMKFAQSAATDPCGDLFDEVPAWTARHHLNPQVVSCFLRLLANDLFQRAREHGAAPHRLLTTLASWPWRTAWKWLARRNASRRASIGHMRRSISRLLWALRRDLRRGNSSRASLEFERLVNGWVRLARQQYLLDQEGEHDAYAPQPRENYSEWVPGVFETQPACGFHNFEVRGRERFRWSEPSAMLWLPPLKGDWKIGIEWAQLRPFSDWGAARFYLNEQQILPANISHRDFRTEIKYSGDGSTSLRLGWLCPALVTKEDDRHLGLPVSRVAWSDDDQRHKMPVTAARSHESFYFLHVPKCAGTTTRQILANAFAARDILSAYDVSLYYARQLKSCPEIYQPYTLAYGHFRWELPTLVSDRRWRILTIVREPLERLLSAYDYSKQQRRLTPGLDFAAWIEQELQLSHVILGHFIPLLSDTEAQGAPSVGALLAEHLTTALTNLNACELVGLQEQLDDSVNLFCAATGMLPPRHVARVNITLHRTRQAEIDGRARELYETYLRPERELYAAAEGIFRRQLADLHRRLAAEVGRELDTSGVRDVLRRRYFERRSREIVEAGIPSEIAWSPADNFPGRNLHDRERHGGQSLRWTGPAPDTVFYFPLQPRRRVKMAIRLHPATPHTHADRARLQVNGAEISLLVERSADGYLLTGVIDPNQPPEECGVLSEFTLTTPVVRGAGEFRELGVALEQISIEPHRMVVPAPHRLGERSAAPLTASR